MSKELSGVTMLHYAKQNIGENGKVTFETPKRLKDAKEVTVTDTYAEGSAYADNRQNIYIKKVTGADITLSLSALKREIEADLTGKKFSKGEMVATNADIQPSVAILYQKTFSDGSYENVIYYNCKLDKTEEGSKTSTDTIELSGVSLSGKATPLEDGTVKYVIASDEIASEDTEIKNKLDNFFKTVQFYGEITG